MHGPSAAAPPTAHLALASLAGFRLCSPSWSAMPFSPTDFSFVHAPPGRISDKTQVGRDMANAVAATAAEGSAWPSSQAKMTPPPVDQLRVRPTFG